MGHRHLLEAGVAALAISMLAAAAHAGPAAAPSAAQNGLTDLRELNLIVLGDMSGGDDVEGKTWVGGTLTNGASFGIGTSNNPGQGFKSSDFPTLTVYGNASGSLDIDDGKNGATTNGITPPGLTVGGSITSQIGGLPNGYTLIVGGTVDSSLNPVNGDTIELGGAKPGASNINGGSASFNLNANNSGFQTNLQATIASQTAAFKIQLSALSQALDHLNGGMSTTGDSVAIGGSNQDLIVSAEYGSGYAVIDVDASTLEAASNKSLEFDLKSSTLPVIINVIDNVTGPITISPNLGSETEGPDVLWNFGTTAQTIDLPNGFVGSVLAPDAKLENGNQLNGSVAVASFTQGGEVHLGTFMADAALSRAVSGVPEPAAWTMMIAGLGLMGAILRRRRGALAA